METIYPLNPVITDNPIFAQKYNAEFMSSYYMSQCLSFDEANKLISQNASFDRVIFLDKESTFVDEFQSDSLGSMAALPELVAISQSENDNETIKKVHDEIRDIRKGTG